MHRLFGRRGCDGGIVVIVVDRGEVLCEGGAGAFAELLDEFKRERAACAFVAVDGRGKENEVGPDEVFDEW